jgi:multiple sugar transport system permease protein
VIGTFQLFNEPSILHNIAPNVIGVDYTPNLYAYNVAFINRDTNYAAAIAFLLGIVIMIVSYTVQLSAQRRERAAR